MLCKVSSLEPFLEALPSLGVMLYISITEPHLSYSSSNRINLTRTYWVTSFSMTLFLKGGPCFFIPRGGCLSVRHRHLEIRRSLHCQHVRPPQQDSLGKRRVQLGCQHILRLPLKCNHCPLLSLPRVGRLEKYNTDGCQLPCPHHPSNLWLLHFW